MTAARFSHIATVALLLQGPPVQAQIIPTGTPAADIVLTAALADQQVFLTCTALDPKSHELAQQFWRDDTAAAVAVLTENNVPADAISAFSAAAAPEMLALPPDTPFAEVVEFCAAQDHWFMRWNRRDFTELAVALPKAFP